VGLVSPHVTASRRSLLDDYRTGVTSSFAKRVNAMRVKRSGNLTAYGNSNIRGAFDFSLGRLSPLSALMGEKGIL